MCLESTMTHKQNMYVHAYVLHYDGMGSIQPLGCVVNRSPTALTRYSRPLGTMVASTAAYFSARHYISAVR